MKTTLQKKNPLSLVVACITSLVIACSPTLTYREAVQYNSENSATKDKKEDAGFLVEAQSFALLEKELNQLAVKNGYASELVKFARRNQTARKKLESELTRVARSEKISLPVSMKGDHQTMLQTLASAEPEEFDRKFISIMKRVNADNGTLYKQYATDAHDTDIRVFAAKKLTLFENNRDGLAVVEDGLR
jgi:predicted outer membrane protein